MTAVPAPAGAGLRLICDGCGSVAEASSQALHDADIVYVAVAEVGWTGSAFARGPHRCPGCEQAGPALARPPREPSPEESGPHRVSRRVLPSASVVEVVGDVDIDVVDELWEALDGAVAERPHVVVDLSRAGTIDSVGLGTLVRGRQAARRRDGNLMLVAPSRFVLTVLRTMRLHTAFPAYDTVARALATADHPAGGR